MSALSTDPAIHVSAMLADYAQVAEGKLNVIGGGWSVTGPEPCPFAIAGLFEIPWTMANREHRFRFELIDVDGNAVVVETPHGPQEIFFEGGFAIGEGVPLPPGSSQTVPFALNGSALPLAPGNRYEWRLSINGDTREAWRLPFMTRSPDDV